MRDQRSRVQVITTGMLMIGLVLLVMSIVLALQSGCGGGAASSRKTTLSAELAAVNTARDMFIRWDREHQMAIVQNARGKLTKAEVKAKIAEHRELQALILVGFGIVYDAIDNASGKDDDASLKRALRLSRHVVDGVRDLKPGKDPPRDWVCGFDLIPEPPLTCP